MLTLSIEMNTLHNSCFTFIYDIIYTAQKCHLYQNKYFTCNFDGFDKWKHIIKCKLVCTNIYQLVIFLQNDFAAVNLHVSKTGSTKEKTIEKNL